MIKKGLQTKKIYSFKIISSSGDELLAYLETQVKNRKKVFLTTPNPEFVIASKDDLSFLKILQAADLTVPDGIGLIWGRQVLQKRSFWGRLAVGFGTGLKVLKGDFSDQVISGIKLLESLCQLATKNNWSVFLMGGKNGVAKKALAVLRQRFPGLKGWATSKILTAKKVNDLVHPRRGQQQPVLLFVALGMKKQEQYIFDNWPKLKVSLAMGVGGAFDQIADPSMRPPKWFDKIGLGWLYRLFRQPWRIKRQLALLRFIWLTLTK